MTSSSSLRYGSVWIDNLFEMKNQELKAQETKYQVLPNFGICCKELGDSKLRVYAHACAVSALSYKCCFHNSGFFNSILHQFPDYE